MIVLHGSLPHRSGPNRSEKSRHAYTLHIIDGTANYPDDNWLQRDPAMPVLGLQHRDRAVLAISHDRHPPFRELDPELMTPPGGRP